MQGDILSVLTESGTKVASYAYDAWGKCTILSETNGIGTLNPIRYRSYYYDTETGLYYLGSRYYDPNTGRFINADVYVSTGQGILGNNMFAYCNNNPISMHDPNGTDAIWLHYPDRAAENGHTSLLLQSDEGEWYYYFWGAKSTGDKVALLIGTDSYHILEPVGMGTLNNISQIIDILSNSSDREATNGLESYIYFEGDFSKSIEYLAGLAEQPYRLTSFNCVQTCVEGLLRGKFSNYDMETKRALCGVRMMTIPNKAYKAMNYFSDNIARYKSSNWVLRFFIKNPYKYIPRY